MYLDNVDLFLHYARLHPSDKRFIKKRLGVAALKKIRLIERVTRGVDSQELRRVSTASENSSFDGAGDSSRIYWNQILLRIKDNSHVHDRTPKLLKAYINSQLS